MPTIFKYGVPEATGMTFDKAYDATAQKHKVPTYDELADEFDLSSCEGEECPLRQVRQCISDTLHFWIDLLETIVSPEQARTSALYENHFFTDSERNNVFALYKRLMLVDRMLIEAAVLANPKADAEAIKKAWSEWANLKKDVLVVVRKMKDAWQKDVTRDDYVGYLG